MSRDPARSAGMLMHHLVLTMPADTAVQRADRATSLADARTALCLATEVALDDIHPASGHDLSLTAYEYSRCLWLGMDLSSPYEAGDCTAAGDYWRRLRPEYVDKLPWPGTGRELDPEDRAECAEEARIKRLEDR